MRISLFSKLQDPTKDRAFYRKSKSYVDALILSGEAFMLSSSAAQLTGWLDRQDPHESNLKRIAGSGFDSAWSINQSGPTGPLVWQMNT